MAAILIRTISGKNCKLHPIKNAPYIIAYVETNTSSVDALQYLTKTDPKNRIKLNMHTIID